MFFEVHSQSVIGYKKLSDADLGRSTSSNLTHIGLFQDSLKFLHTNHNSLLVTLIFKNSSQRLMCFVDYITTQDGSERSPKIRKGTSSELGSTKNSIVKEIRKIVESDLPSTNWYLLWFGLENQSLVFFLIKENSQDYKILLSMIANLKRGQLYNTDNRFSRVVNFLNEKVNYASYEYLEDLELMTLTNNQNIVKKINPQDFERAKQVFSTIGKKGEERIAMYFEQLKISGKIRDYNWVNQSRESYFPYDFEVITQDNNRLFTDVKSTNYRFEQKVYFSKQELEFISSVPDQYLLQRVYNLEEQAYLRECYNMNIIANVFNHNYMNFNNSMMQNDLSVENLNVSFKPIHANLEFNPQIVL